MKAPLVLAAIASFACLPQDLRAQPSDVMLEVRQIVIRAPELEVVELMAAATRKSGDEMHAALCQAVRRGRASVVADITSAADDLKVEARQGRNIWLVSERDQDFDRLYLQPIGFQEFFVGSSLEVHLRGLGAKGASAGWHASCSPCGPAMTRWPTSWLRPFTREHKPHAQGKLIRGWLDNYDVFTESVVADHWFANSKMQLLGVTPPGDQTWPGAARAGRWLDVFLAQIKPLGDGQVFEPAAKEQEPAIPPPRQAEPVDPFANQDAGKGAGVADTQVMLYGIGLNATEAALLIAQRDLADDAALLQRLLARVKEGHARLQVCVGMTAQSGGRGTVTAARQHQYPIEMPSIPSAWTARPVGTVLEIEDRAWSLRHDLAPPHRSEWRLALDDPKAVMWEPRFRTLTITSAFPQSRGVHLVGLQCIPGVMSGDGIAENETVLLFARRDDDKPDAAPPQAMEAELLVLEVPGTDPAVFGKPPEGPFRDDAGAEAQFGRLLNQLKTGEVSVAAHVLLSTLPDQRSVIRAAEEFMYATEFDPPEGGEPRIRPTALETAYAGDLLEIEMAVHPAQPKIAVQVSFTHSTGIPKEPPLETALAFAAKDELMRDYPPPEHPLESWAPIDISLEPGKALFLGARKPPGIQRKVVHVAYLKVRKVP